MSKTFDHPASLTIGTRGSPLALTQANMVKDRLAQIYPAMEIDLKIIKTSGDWMPSDGETRLPEAGRGKALFAKEIEENLLAGTIDIAVHSMKDMDSHLPEGLEIAAMLPRENPADAILLRERNGHLKNTALADWPAGTTIATVSARRQAMILAINPHLKVIPLRGNVETRLSKLRGDLAKDHPEMEATLLAVAGLNRLGMADEIDLVLDPQIYVPAASQGAVGIEILSQNIQLKQILAAINCSKTQIAVEAERAVLRTIDGSCHTPIGVHAEFTAHNEITLHAVWNTPDGKQSVKGKISAAATNLKEAHAAGEMLGKILFDQATPDLKSQTTRS